MIAPPKLFSFLFCILVLFSLFLNPKIQHPKIGRSRNWPKSTALPKVGAPKGGAPKCGEPVGWGPQRVGRPQFRAFFPPTTPTTTQHATTHHQKKNGPWIGQNGQIRMEKTGLAQVGLFPPTVSPIQNSLLPEARVSDRRRPILPAVLPFTRLTLCYIRWSDSCAELGPSPPPLESLTVQCLLARVELSRAIFLTCCIPTQTLDHRVVDCRIALADHGDRVGPRSPIGCPGTPTCRPHCMSGTRGWRPKDAARHRRASSSSPRVSAALPMGIPRTLMPSDCHASGPS